MMHLHVLADGVKDTTNRWGKTDKAKAVQEINNVRGEVADELALLDIGTDGIEDTTHGR
jgi:hypothetical protein